MAIDQTYQTTIEPSMIIWMEGTNSSLESLSELLVNNRSCLITEASARMLGITQRGDYISLSLKPNSLPAAPSETLQVAGIVSELPGFTNIHMNPISLSSHEALIVSPVLYFNLLEHENMSLSPSRKIDKIMLMLDENTLEYRNNFVKSFNSLFQTEYSYAISDPVQKFEFISQNEQVTHKYNYMIIIFSVFVNFIGIGFAYTTLLQQRKHQFRILTAIGVGPTEKRRMLYQEMFIHFVSSSILGGVIGTLLSLIIFRNIAQLSEMPFLISLDYLSMGLTFLGTLVFCILALAFSIGKQEMTRGYRSD